MTAMASLGISKLFFFIIATALACCMRSTLASSIGTRRMLEHGIHGSSLESDEDAAFAEALDSSHESIAWGPAHSDDPALYPLQTENSAFTTSTEPPSVDVEFPTRAPRPPKPPPPHFAFPSPPKPPSAEHFAFPTGAEPPPPKPPSVDIGYPSPPKPPSADFAFPSPTIF